MSSENFEALITLSPPNTDDKIKLELKLYPTDIIDTTDGAKLLRNCTLEELGAYANLLEVEVGEAYRQMTIAELLLDKPSEMAVNTDADGWLDKVVMLDGDEMTAPQAAAPEAEQVVIEEIVLADSAESTQSTPPDAEPAVEEEITIEPSKDEVAESDGSAEPQSEVEDIPIASSTVDPIDRIKIATTESNVEDRDAVSEFVIKTTDQTAGVISSENQYNLNSAVHILLDEKPLRKMQEHASSSMRREVAGVMVGPIPEKQPDGRYVVHVTDMIVAKHTIMSGASVTYTPESWRYMNDQLFGRYPDESHVMVGWYHTHPGFGIFLSNMDLFIHTNFFTQIWHTAYVLDPVGKTSGFFSWDRKQTQVLPYDFEWPKWAPHSW